ncbi:MAG: PspC domain-containing protein [Gammaproteobacteria bacterium]|nr:PspC domain-containing protein [Gammaproteobacteria bacterium]
MNAATGFTRIYRDPERGVILGVCAGVADAFDFDVTVLRIITVVLLFFLPMVTVIAYLVLALLLKTKCLRYHGVGDERDFWRYTERKTSYEEK